MGIKNKITYRIILLLLAIGVVLSCEPKSERIEVDSLQEFAKYITQDDVVVTLKPGVYVLNDTTLSKRILLKKYKDGKPSIDYPISSLLHFSGNGSRYILNDVVINIDTHLHQAFGQDHIFEIFVSGNHNVIEGLEVRDLGEEIPLRGAIMMHVMGDGNTISNVQLHIKGSYPYGYGHLLGKGANPIVKPQKHSSLLVSGKDTKLLGCKVITRGFGHGIVMQGAYNTYIKDCYVEGEMRTTNAMLSETSGPAFDSEFKSDYPPGKIMPNEIKSLSEDGVRSYPYGYLVGRKTEHITVINTTVKNMRSGFDLSAHIGETFIDGCTAIGNQEKGYSVSKNAVIKDSKGDAMYGPLLSFHGNTTENCEVELQLMHPVGEYPVQRLAELNGTGHKITLSNFEDKSRATLTPIVFGESFWSDVHRYRYPDKDAKAFSGAYNITLINKTGMPIVFEKLSQHNAVISNGEMLKDLGVDNTFKHSVDHE
ncbi:conserved hypothetical protein [Formosa agariphila KMM 3901]|uniref:Uncharacterized protein n=1 Tax=Formosa agariphila (strain DSM 15362 / KCTC 12365 / LMG 23005 / KMM 3901 / M-2Alg 35-1) TaxID=1347342 RepID=T2KMA7_FORAG|nr:hypothetical protein [Formosa agariphila]CDF79576.1 conserved hypothetical protein [Formosa agariphila KMM 3901]